MENIQDPNLLPPPAEKSKIKLFAIVGILVVGLLAGGIYLSGGSGEMFKGTFQNVNRQVRFGDNEEDRASIMSLVDRMTLDLKNLNLVQGDVTAETLERTKTPEDLEAIESVVKNFESEGILEKLNDRNSLMTALTGTETRISFVQGIQTLASVGVVSIEGELGVFGDISLQENLMTPEMREVHDAIHSGRPIPSENKSPPPSPPRLPHFANS